jgi:hypothetical protein
MKSAFSNLRKSLIPSCHSQVEALQDLYRTAYLYGIDLGQFLCSWSLDCSGRDSHRRLWRLSTRLPQPPLSVPSVDCGIPARSQ